MKPNPFSTNGAKRHTTERDDHIVELFNKVNDWFFDNDTTNFDPTYLESIEEYYETHGYLTDRQYEGLQNIYNNFVLN